MDVLAVQVAALVEVFALENVQEVVKALVQELAKAVADVRDVEIVVQPLVVLVADALEGVRETALIHVETVVPHLALIVALDALEDAVDVVLIVQELVKIVAKRLVQQHVSQIVQEPVLEI